MGLPSLFLMDLLHFELKSFCCCQKMLANEKRGRKVVVLYYLLLRWFLLAFCWQSRGRRCSALSLNSVLQNFFHLLLGTADSMVVEGKLGEVIFSSSIDTDCFWQIFHFSTFNINLTAAVIVVDKWCIVRVVLSGIICIFGKSSRVMVCSTTWAGNVPREKQAGGWRRKDAL